MLEMELVLAGRGCKLQMCRRLYSHRIIFIMFVGGCFKEKNITFSKNFFKLAHLYNESGGNHQESEI